jgi:hypothetical protein
MIRRALQSLSADWQESSQKTRGIVEAFPKCGC